MISPRDATERFHLILLRALVAGPDKTKLVLKGGCNLRFFHGSPRYSEDMDIDVIAGTPSTLRKNVDKALTGPLVTGLLKASGIAVAQSIAAKQTETTQRWKIRLRVDGLGAPLGTKVEFSRRGGNEAHAVDRIKADVLDRHRLPPMVAAHYPARSAFLQKVAALVGRSPVQARDVFDLDLLRRGLPGEVPEIDGVMAREAIARTMAIAYVEYKGKVLAFLDPEQRAPFESAQAWEGIQLAVAHALEEAVR
jgi:hypothetical protein